MTNMKKMMLSLSCVAIAMAGYAHQTGMVCNAATAVDAMVSTVQQTYPAREGDMAPDFVLRDINGNDLSLSSLRGKYVVIDFWGSWCGWCIKGMPEMKKYYAKYADRMEILGIDCGDSDQQWKEAVAKHQLPWKHVYNPRESKLLASYGIEGFPTKMVIDPQGKIVKIVVGEDPVFYTFLDQLFTAQ